MPDETIQKYQTVEMNEGDLALWRWVVGNKPVFERIMTLKKTKVKFYLDERKKIDPRSFDIIKKGMT